jgi:hypothetical protein
VCLAPTGDVHGQQPSSLMHPTHPPTHPPTWVHGHESMMRTRRVLEGSLQMTDRVPWGSPGLPGKRLEGRDVHVGVETTAGKERLL